MSFCSREDLAARDPMAGTGVRADAYVFLPVAKRFWGANEMNSNWASPQELAAIVTARRAGVLTRLYNPPRKDTAKAEILVHRSPDRSESAALPPLLAAFAPRWPVQEPARPQLAICTHGTRDRCCAKWGFAAHAEAMRLFTQGRSPFEPLECSHLGGDRYAATGVFFPSGSMYAHLDSVDLAEVTAAEAARRITAETYRGRVFEPPLTQVVRAGLARDGLYNDATSPLVLNREDALSSQVWVSAENGGRRFEVTLGAVQVRFYASCAKLAKAQAATGQRTTYAAGRALELETGG